jgi:electron transport complex protein RnfE
MEKKKIFLAGIFKENPNLAMFLGTCPTLATTTSLDNALGMGIAVIFVLVLSNIAISLIRKTVPDEIRIPVYIVIIAAIVSVVEMLMQAYTPSIYSALGIFIPLIVVNCIILGRAEAFASKNSVLDSIVDGFGMGIGFTCSLLIMATFRQVLGTGVYSLNNLFNSTQNIFRLNIFSSDYAIGILTQPAGGFLTFGLIVAIINAVGLFMKKHKKEQMKVEAK